MLLSVIIPCYNEEKVINGMYESLRVNCDAVKASGFDAELIFVDDGSRDNTRDILKSLAEKDPIVRYISFSRNFGKEAAMLCGLNYSSGDCVIIMDADLQHPPELIPQMVEGFLEGYDQVIARRNRKGDKAGNSFFARRYYKMVNRMTDVDMPDGEGDFRLLSRKAVNALLSMDEYNRFSKGMFSWIGFRQKVIEYENRQRAAGETKWTFRKLLSYGIGGIMSFNDKPLRICFVLGGVSIFLCLVYMIVTLIQIIISGITVPGYFTTICAIMILGGLQLLSIGVLGEYIGKIYYEVKGRPHYLVDETNMDSEAEKEDKENELS